MLRGESYTLNSSTKELIQDAASVLVNKLAAAIQAGENDQAKQIVDKLASLKLKLDISIPKDENEQRSKEKEFSIRVHVEDRVSEGCYFNLMVKACDTITDLKRKVMLIHDFPMEVQRWIIGKKIFSDTDKLGQCGVKASNHTIYLYLVTARSVGLNQQSYQQERQSLIEGRALQPLALSQEGDDSCAWTPLQQGLEELEHTIVHSGMASRQASKASLTSSSSLLQELVSNNALQHSPPPNAASERPRSVRTESMLLEQSNFSSGYRSKTPPRSPSAVKKNEPVGWQCSICTLINLPIRPGCEACAAPRPSNYCIPPGYQLTPEELALYEKEQQMERLTREAAPPPLTILSAPNNRSSRHSDIVTEQQQELARALNYEASGQTALVSANWPERASPEQHFMEPDEAETFSDHQNISRARAMSLISPAENQNLNNAAKEASTRSQSPFRRYSAYTPARYPIENNQSDEEN
ncbi:ranBP-type and C3HC4-type zinc finger-containing protein 1 [Biomphalaria glabrata]|nr:ranBP-type and C3HC4-type zinc finger-containing protein 1-like [Biomphalaria glabrata]